MIETAFTPLASLVGGVLIGLAATLLMLVAGRVMGATGVLAGIVQPASAQDFGWRVALLAGMVSGPAVVWLISGDMPALQVPNSTAAFVIGGLIVGFGVTFGSGCTSGHGVCGLARLSPRSLAATLTFMACAFVTVFVIRHVIGG
ncbi:YeeE/YedE family protein [Sulfitobacter sp. M57]|nr:YeeE/YedE family protein [Sulfitobacter sp. KE5]MDF3423600.1 YeeE/YedE family protein [Sulfitobacter sp. KE43]MDF3434598.1 YeeE/YedE family protein [Sulfitobacter sp. KE42]MDF3460306.1 YeeE/YedE family protein [Sulfitobacter sp. S74]MDF3464136.1 YeeE/YedE family protein [Sulfitobacter sp. Ks18]MDF3468245.1 YeeE/YedE family protein [Sulfitobacter sp. M05]MDF3471931.1 YeeE/YedE family protein [Sulfitobacter sp. M28]MDF3475680.1 YeeE/YedE family protein [Sulfitobacter sp. M48]MDF3479651.1 Y